MKGYVVMRRLLSSSRACPGTSFRWQSVWKARDGLMEVPGRARDDMSSFLLGGVFSPQRPDQHGNQLGLFAIAIFRQQVFDVLAGGMDGYLFFLGDVAGAETPN